MGHETRVPGKWPARCFDMYRMLIRQSCLMYQVVRCPKYVNKIQQLQVLGEKRDDASVCVPGTSNCKQSACSIRKPANCQTCCIVRCSRYVRYILFLNMRQSRSFAGGKIRLKDSNPSTHGVTGYPRLQGGKFLEILCFGPTPFSSNRPNNPPINRRSISDRRFSWSPTPVLSPFKAGFMAVA